MAKRNNKDVYWPKGGFAGIPRMVMNGPDYQGLSGNAVKLLNEFARQYNGKNNGDLACAWSLLRERGFKSKGTIQRAKKELLACHLIEEVRTGIAGVDGRRVCSLYALSWQNLDEVFYPSGDPKHNRSPTNKPLRRDWTSTTNIKPHKIKTRDP